MCVLFAWLTVDAGFGLFAWTIVCLRLLFVLFYRLLVFLIFTVFVLFAVYCLLVVFLSLFCALVVFSIGFNSVGIWYAYEYYL